MKSTKPFSFDILGGRDNPSKTGVVSAMSWLSKLGSVSLIIGAASVIAGHAREIWSRESDRSAPVPRRFGNLPRVEKRVKALSSSDLLSRQNDFRLPGQKRNYSLAGPLAGADNCPGTPIPAGIYTAANPYTDSGNTSGANNTVWNYGGGYYYSYSSGPDHVYSFTLTARGANPRIEVSTSSSNYDLMVYVANGMFGNRCPAGVNNSVYSIAYRDHYQPGGTEILDNNDLNSLPLNIPLHLFVDSWAGNAGGPYTVKFQDVTVAENPMPPANDAPLDMDGDGRSDFVIARNNGGQITWYTRTSNDTFLSPVNWGAPGDILVPANYDADGKVDYAVWRPGPQGRFYIIRSQTQTILTDDFGQTGDDPTIVADYNGDGLADPAVYRAGATPGAPSYWYYRHRDVPDGFVVSQFGQYGDKAVPGDFNGDGYPDRALRRVEGAYARFMIKWWWDETVSYAFGLASDVVVPGDYDNDGITDLAVARVGGDGNFVWDFEPSASPDFTVNRSVWGVAATDILAPGDYDGDGQTEFAVWRPGDPGTFFVKKPGTGLMRAVTWGQAGDVPVASFYTR